MKLLLINIEYYKVKQSRISSYFLFSLISFYHLFSFRSEKRIISDPYFSIINAEDLLARGKKLNRNFLNKGDLELIPGISDKLSNKIVAYVKENDITTLNELESIKGIGPKTVEKLSNYIKTE
jgi:3-methyladenine DNA glycosylase/8-oxoguanine DNA glycosylase